MSGVSVSNVTEGDRDTEDFVLDDEEYFADITDRSGLPDIPRGTPEAGDTIDIEQITREYSSRAAVKRANSNVKADVPLRTIKSSSSSAQPTQEEEDDEVSQSRTPYAFRTQTKQNER